MYDYLKGILVEVTPLHAVVDIGGVGYKLQVPINFIGSGERLGQSVMLYTSWVVRELSQTLYGFSTRDERNLFELLITLSGIGPKTALSLVGHLSAADLRQAIETRNAAVLAQVPGIGKKTAERLLVDLKGKSFSTSQPLKVRGKEVGDAVQALINLGYSQAAAEKALQLAAEEISDATDLPLLISTALRLNRSLVQPR